MFTQYFSCCFRNVTSVVPGDYDGDSQMDVLLTAKNGQETEVFIFWGHNQTLGTALIVIYLQMLPCRHRKKPYPGQVASLSQD